MWLGGPEPLPAPPKDAAFSSLFSLFSISLSPNTDVVYTCLCTASLVWAYRKARMATASEAAQNAVGGFKARCLRLELAKIWTTFCVPSFMTLLVTSITCILGS